MAGSAEKKQAQHNVQALKEIHAISLGLNLLALLCVCVIRRPANWMPYVLFSIPGLACEYVIERIGRPKYRTDEARGYQILVTAGDDLRQSGLTEYMFDVFYLTMAADLLMCILGSNKVWWILALVPVYAGYKLFGLWSKFRGARAVTPSQDKAPVTGEPQKSKRQLKREARASKPHYSRH